MRRLLLKSNAVQSLFAVDKNFIPNIVTQKDMKYHYAIIINGQHYYYSSNHPFYAMKAEDENSYYMVMHNDVYRNGGSYDFANIFIGGKNSVAYYREPYPRDQATYSTIVSNAPIMLWEE